MLKEALFYKQLENNIVRCEICPHHCKILPNKTGLCFIRKNIDGVLYLTTYGEISSIALDPIEKKPLYHFYPGSHILSIGSNGCNLKCPFCQNWQISTSETQRENITIEELIKLAKKHTSIGIAYTYNEPLIWYEFLLDALKEVHKNNLNNVLVTNGNINKEPLEELVPFIDAANVDLKGFTEDFYKWIGGNLKSTINFIETLFKNNIHIELTNLVIPGKNDDTNIFTDMCKWIRNISENIPLHLSRYFPNYKLDISPTPEETLKRLYNIAKKYLQYVYIGNISIKDTNSTYCPRCKTLLIDRQGYTTKIYTNKNKCPECEELIPLYL
jgi:pyruvate formate lyase activating enzyme